MKLLLDEMYSSEIARKLRGKGHDVIAVTEVPALVGSSDRRLVDVALAEGRTVVTNNAADFMPLANSVDHHGFLFSDDRSLPRSKNTIRVFVRVLGRCLESHKADAAMRGTWTWLMP